MPTKWFRIYLEGRVHDLASDETRDVSHVAHEQGANRVGQRTHALVVPLARVRRAAADDQLRAEIGSHRFL